MTFQRNLHGIYPRRTGLYDKVHTIQTNQNKLDESSVYTQTTVNFFAYDNYFCIERDAPVLKTFKLLMENFVLLFKAACVAMNLIENDEMWINCMDEAMNLYTAASCTNLLIAILCENEVANPWDMFDRYHEFLLKDFLYHHQQQQQQHPHEVALNDLLFSIQEGLQMKGKMNSDMDLPEPNYNLVQQADLMAEPIDPTADSFLLENEPKLYEEQCSFLNRVLHLLRNDEDGFLIS